VRIESLDAHARGLASLGRRALRVPNALAGETLDVRLGHVGRHVAVGRIASVVEPAPARVRDACPHRDECPGCGMRTTALDRRLEFKRARIVDALAAAGVDGVDVAETVAAPSEDGWRHKAYVTPRRTRKGIVVGLFEEGTHRLVPIDGCPAHAVPVERAVEGVRRALTMVGPSVYDERSRLGWLRHVSVRASHARGSTVVTLVVRDEGGGDARRLADEIVKHAPHVVGVVRNVHGDPGNAPYGPSFEVVRGVGEIEEASGAFRLVVSAGSFFQVNPPAASALADAVEREALLGPPGWALDVYGGVGATALRLARSRDRVVLVESPGPAARDAERNAGRHAPGRVEVLARRAEAALPRLLSDRPAVVVLNPPRGGLSEAARAGIAAAPPPLLLYVSCGPESLARDAGDFAAAGLAVSRITPFDLMPQTPHVEAVAVFAKSL
jgi:23S rRNA (uracil-5-)-methyltransferase RumA